MTIGSVGKALFQNSRNRDNSDFTIFASLNSRITAKSRAVVPNPTPPGPEGSNGQFAYKAPRCTWLFFFIDIHGSTNIN